METPGEPSDSWVITMETVAHRHSDVRCIEAEQVRQTELVLIEFVYRNNRQV